MRVEFPNTMWSLILRAGEGSVGALNGFAGIYRPVVEDLAAAYGFARTDADDLAQEVLLALCDPEFLVRTDREKGRFRDIVFALARNKMRDAWRRRARRREKALDEAEETPDEAEMNVTLERIWRQQLVSQAMARMQEAEVQSPHPPYHAVLRRHRIEGVPLAIIARDLGTNVMNVTNWIRRAKERLAEHIRAIVRSYSSSEAEYQGELELFA